MTPSFIGLMATMFPGVRPSMSLASFPTASTRPFTLLIATIEGSLTTMPLPRAYTHVLAVPRSMARSLENSDIIERILKRTPVESVGVQWLVPFRALPATRRACSRKCTERHEPLNTNRLDRSSLEYPFDDVAVLE